MGADDKSFVSPIQNVVDALERTSPEMDVVVYVHVDGLLNLTIFFQGQAQIPTDKFMGNLQHIPDSSYSITIPSFFSSQSPLQNAKRKKHHEIICDIPSHTNSTPIVDRKQFLHSPTKWKSKEHCIQHQLNILTRPNSQVKEFSANYPPLAFLDSQARVSEWANGLFAYTNKSQGYFCSYCPILYSGSSLFGMCFSNDCHVGTRKAKRRMLPTLFDTWNAPDDKDHHGSSKNYHGSSRSLMDQ